MRLSCKLDGERVAIDRGERGRGERANDKPESDADRGEKQSLDHVHAEHETARCAEAFESGDDLALLRHVAPDRVADADATEEERGQSHEIDELGEAVGVAAERWRRVGPVMDGEAALGEALLDVLARLCEGVLVGGGGLGQLHPVGPADQASRLHQSRLGERVARHQDLGSVSEAVGEPVRLLAENAADGRGGLADEERAADVDAKPVEQGALDQDHVAVAPDRPGIFRPRDGDLAIERIGIVDRLHLDQRALAVLRAGHGAEACRVRLTGRAPRARRARPDWPGGGSARRKDRHRSACGLGGRAPRRTRRRASRWPRPPRRRARYRTRTR